MPVKTILILANSVRHLPNACVAGREVIEHRGESRFGSWVRPVSTHGDGELSPQERRTAQGREVQVLDIVRMSVGERTPDALQPENWRYSPSPWEVIGRGTAAELARACEEHTSLWDDPRDPPDRVSEARAQNSPPPQSLYLIAVDGVLIRLFSEQYPERTRKHRRALFRYSGREYNLAITDPTIEARYGLQVPTPFEAAVEHRVPQAYICVSLAYRSFQGHHYKLAAAIIDLEHL